MTRNRMFYFGITMFACFFAQAEEQTEICTTSTAHVKFMWIKVWENEVEIPCDQLEEETPVTYVKANVEAKSEVPSCDYDSYLFGSIKWCSDEQQSDEEGNDVRTK